ncbi:hypothetical protein HZC30_03310 [Candidatus Woesearchaeota archaeon]|nr:hypothetical protein [Candidatus Woesearchaeota archaeon]
MTDRRITQTNPKLIVPKRRWYDKIRDEYASLEKELDEIADAYSDLEQRIKQEESSPEFLLTLDHVISFAYDFARLEKLPELLQKYTLPLARHLKNVRTEKGEPDKDLQQRGERVCEDLQEWSGRFSSLYESRWYKKGLHQQVEEIVELAGDKNISSDKRTDKIKKSWYGGIIYPGIQKNLNQLFDLIEEALHPF